MVLLLVTSSAGIVEGALRTRRTVFEAPWCAKCSGVSPAFVLDCKESGNAWTRFVIMSTLG